MEYIKKILRMTKTNDSTKIWLIWDYLSEDRKDNYGMNKLVKLSLDEFKKLNRTYGKQVIKNMIDSLDWYIYIKGKKYVSHYLTICNWCNREWVKKLPETYKCSYGWVHRKWEDCKCMEF